MFFDDEHQQPLNGVKVMTRMTLAGYECGLKMKKQQRKQEEFDPSCSRGGADFERKQGYEQNLFSTQKLQFF